MFLKKNGVDLQVLFQYISGFYSTEHSSNHLAPVRYVVILFPFYRGKNCGSERQEKILILCFLKRNGIRDPIRHPWGHQEEQRLIASFDWQILPGIRDHPLGLPWAHFCLCGCFSVSANEGLRSSIQAPHTLRSLRQEGRHRAASGCSSSPSPLPQALCHPFSISSFVSLFSTGEWPSRWWHVVEVTGHELWRGVLASLWHHRWGSWGPEREPDLSKITPWIPEQQG